MSQIDGFQAFYLALLLVLPISALVARRMPIGDLARMVLGWVAIFALLLLAVALYQRWRAPAVPPEAPPARGRAYDA